MFLTCLLLVVCLFIKKQHFSNVLYFKDLVFVRINITPAEWTAVREGEGKKLRYNSKGNMRFGQEKASEKSGHFISDSD